MNNSSLSKNKSTKLSYKHNEVSYWLLTEAQFGQTHHLAILGNAAESRQCVAMVTILPNSGSQWQSRPDQELSLDCYSGQGSNVRGNVRGWYSRLSQITSATFPSHPPNFPNCQASILNWTNTLTQAQGHQLQHLEVALIIQVCIDILP